MDSSVSPKDEIWFLRVHHHISNAVLLQSTVFKIFATAVHKMLTIHRFPNVAYCPSPHSSHHSVSIPLVPERSARPLQINPLNPELNPICYLLALSGAHHFLHVSRIRVKLLTLWRLMSYIYGAPILDVSRSHTTTQHSR